MKSIAAGVLLFGAAMCGLAYVNANGARASWMVAGALYVFPLVVVQFLRPTTTLKQSVQLNALIAFVVTILVFIDSLVLHRGLFKDVNPSGEGLLYRTGVLVVGVGVPTTILGSFFGWIVGRIARRRRSKLTRPSDPPIRV